MITFNAVLWNTLCRMLYTGDKAVKYTKKFGLYRYYYYENDDQQLKSNKRVKYIAGVAMMLLLFLVVSNKIFFVLHQYLLK